MIDTPESTDGSENPTDRYLSLVLEIDDALAQGRYFDVDASSRDGLTDSELNGLVDARHCLQNLYDSARAARSGDRGCSPTLTLSHAAEFAQGLREHCRQPAANFRSRFAKPESAGSKCGARSGVAGTELCFSLATRC